MSINFPEKSAENNQKTHFFDYLSNFFLKFLRRLHIAAQRPDAIIEGDIGVRILLVEKLLHPLHDHIAGGIVHRGQKQGKNGGRKMGDGIALAQVGFENFQGSVHDIILLDGIHGGIFGIAHHDHAQEHGGTQAFKVTHL